MARSTVSIVSFGEAHLPDLYRISLATGHAGGDASHLYADRELIGHIYSAPYAVLEPSLVLLAIDDAGVAGFALGVVDATAWEDRLEREWWPTLRAKYKDPDPALASSWTADQRRAHMIHHPARVPAAIVNSYPAHMHMNLLPRLQGTGVGPRMLEAWLRLVASRHARGVHVGVNRDNVRGAAFWSRTGFRELALEGLDPGRTIWMARGLEPSAAKGATR